MRSIAVVPRKKEVKLIEQQEPRITAPTEVKLRMLEVGVCGTDREICSFQYGTPPAGLDYLVIGHESLGEVIEVGPKVTRLRHGDLVVPTVRRPCSHAGCVACRAGQRDFCTTGDFTERGIKQAHGFMTRMVVDDESYMNLVPRELRDVAVLVEPLTIAEKALIQVNQIQERLPWTCPEHPGEKASHCHRALVLGAGPVGLLGAMALKVAGYQTFVYSREPASDAKAKLVRSLGAGYISATDVPVQDLPGAVGGSIDLIYEATGASRLAFEAIEELGANGIFVFTGVPGRKGPVAVDTDLIMRNLVLKNQVVFGTVNAGKEAFEAAIRDLGTFMKRFPSAVVSMITGRFPVEAHRDLLLGPLTGIKNVITLQ